MPEDINAAGGIGVDEEVVVDGNLFMPRLPLDLPAFMWKILVKVASIQQRWINYFNATTIQFSLATM